MRILVTGASGTVGRQMPKDLDNHEIWTTSRTGTEGGRHTVADLADIDGVTTMLGSVRPDAVIHLAGAVTGSEAALALANVVTTRNLVESVDPAVHLIVVGSAAEFGAPATDIVASDAPLAPLSRYGKSKAQQTGTASTIGARRGVRVTIARPFNVVSPAMPTSTALGNAASTLLAARRRGAATLRVGRTDIVRDFIPVRFVADALIALATAQTASGSYNICSGTGMTLGEIIAAMAAELGLPLTMVKDPELAALPAADRVVGDPERLAEETGLIWTRSIPELVSTALER